VSFRAAIPACIVALVHGATTALTEGEGELSWMAAALVALGVAEGLLSYTRTRITKRIAWSVAHDVRTDLHRALLDQHLSSERRTGTDLTLLSSQADEVQYMVSAIVTLLRAPLTLCGLFGAMIYADWRLAVCGAFLLPLTAGIARAGGHWMRMRSTRWRDARKELLALGEDQLRNLAAVQAYVAETMEARRFAQMSAIERDARIRLETDKVLPRAVTRIAALSLLAGLLFFGGEALIRGVVAPADLLAVLIALGLASRPLSDLAEGWSLYQRSDSAYQHLSATLALHKRRPSASRSVRSSEALAVRLEALTVCFEQGTSPFAPFDLKIEPGECVAITAPSGTGKTTIFRLLGKYLPSFNGRIHVGGQPIDAWSVEEIRERLGVVHQEPLVFARTLAENLSLNELQTPSDMTEALEMSGAVSLLEAPGGLHRPLGEGGAPLSGGEMQRLCLARAILHAKGLLLLDEPTSHLDDATVEVFGNAVQRIKHEHTILIATHDARLLRFADRVVALSPHPSRRTTSDA